MSHFVFLRYSAVATPSVIAMMITIAIWVSVGRFDAVFLGDGKGDGVGCGVGVGVIGGVAVG